MFGVAKVRIEGETIKKEREVIASLGLPLS